MWRGERRLCGGVRHILCVYLGATRGTAVDGAVLRVANGRVGDIFLGTRVFPARGDAVAFIAENGAAMLGVQ